MSFEMNSQGSIHSYFFRGALTLVIWASSVAMLHAEPPPLLLQEPTIHLREIVFVFAGDLWRVPREGGDAVRLTTHPGREHHPHYSPDGSLIAFSGDYDGNTDVFVVEATGGVPVRLTSHPGPDIVSGWSPDGKRILFSSRRESATDSSQLFTVPVNGGPAEVIPLPRAEAGAFSPDGSHLAYVPVLQWQKAWKRYQGGQTRPIWIAALEDSSIEKVPRENSNDSNPMWMGDTVYFLSDRNGAVSLFGYDTKSKSVREMVKNQWLDIHSASAGPDALVYEQFGTLHVLEPKTGNDRVVPVRIHADLAEVRPHFKKLEAKQLNGGRLSPTGQRAVFEVRGDILTVPAEKGDVRNLTQTPGVAERDPAWSPDGKSIAYFSDLSGEYALHVRRQDGTGTNTVFALGEPPSFFYSPIWSPDGKCIAYADKRGQYWLLRLTNGTPQKIDSAIYGGNDPNSLAWSPDSRWLAYTRDLDNTYRAVFVFSLVDSTSHQLTDGLGDAAFPVFADSGQYLYFATSTDIGPGTAGGDLSAINRPVTRSVYVAVLDKSSPSPLAAESDEEKGETAKEADGKKTEGGDKGAKASETAKAEDSKKESAKSEDKKPEIPEVKIDFANFSQRILSLPLPAKNYRGLVAGKSNVLFALEGPTLEPMDSDSPSSFLVQRFDLAKRKTEKFLENAKAFVISANREKVLFQKGDAWFIAGADAPPKDGDGALKTGDYQLFVDPRAEWRQMYRETWRIERDFLYDPGLHGLDLAATMSRYAPYLEGLASRADLNYLFEEMLGEITIGHMFVGGGDNPEVTPVKVGLLGADLRVENGRHRFSRIFDGENWNPNLRAPLTEPGVNVAVGEYLLAVDGREVSGTSELFSYFQDKANRIVVLKVGPNPNDTGSREVKIKTIEDDGGLRHRAWVEDNRRTVAKLSQGRLGYVHLPDTAVGGYTSFTRYYFAQRDKQGFVIDERFNHGGLLADYVVDHLRRPVMNYAIERDGRELSFPFGAHPGPKVMLINECAGSGGDALPWYFRKAGIGPLVGKRTWGGLVGIGGYPSLLDGGSVMAPRWAIYGTEGKWEVENVGIAPDVEVDLDPKSWRAGHDTQLEKAVELALEALAKNPPQPHPHPPYPNYHRK